MPSLDGYSLSKEIEKLREDIFGELLEMREAFREIYFYLDKMNKQQKENEKCQAKQGATKSKTQKKGKTAKSTEASTQKETVSQA